MGAGSKSWRDNFSPRADRALGVIGACIARVVLDPAVSIPTFASVAEAAFAEAAKSGEVLLEQVTASLECRRLRHALLSLLDGADELRRKTPPLGDPAMSLLLARRGWAEWEPPGGRALHSRP